MVKNRLNLNDKVASKYIAWEAETVGINRGTIYESSGSELRAGASMKLVQNRTVGTISRLASRNM